MKEQSKKKATQKILDWMRGESEEFMKSGAGKNNSDYVPIKGDIGKNPDKKHGSGFGNAYGAPSVQVDPKSKTMNGKQIADFISEHARGNHGAQINDFGAGLKIKKPESGGVVNDPYTAMKYTAFAQKMANMKGAKAKSKFALSDDDVVIGATGAAGAAVGGAINEAMDENEAERKKRSSQQSSGPSQQNAHSYWTRKKSGP